MDQMIEKMNKLREERQAREKARIDKLRELNLKKYNKTETEPSSFNKSIKFADVKSKISNPGKPNVSTSSRVNSAPQLNGCKKLLNAKTLIPQKRVAKPAENKLDTIIARKVPDVVLDANKNDNKTQMVKNKPTPQVPPRNLVKTMYTHKNADSKINMKNTRKTMVPTLQHTDKPANSRKSLMPSKSIDKKCSAPTVSVAETKKLDVTKRKSLVPISTAAGPTKTVNRSRKTMFDTKETVFDRLYKPKPSKTVENVDKIPENVLRERRSVFVPSSRGSMSLVRRSISAVHLKRIAQNELPNCMHKWASISENINKADLKDEDHAVNQEKVVPAIKSESKRVKLQKPMYFTFNSPQPHELQSRLKKWLEKRGKSIQSYHHLHCFGLHHMSQMSNLKPYDEEDKENIEVANVENDLYLDGKGDVESTGWRRASYSTNECDETIDTIASQETHNVEELLVGVLNDLTDLLRDGYDWEQCARWLRVIREQFPFAAKTAAYWECRAALEERQDNLSASVRCWEEAIANGSGTDVAEVNLDNLLDKFMQLKISPTSAKKLNSKVNPKMVDARNVFKSTIIRFAVQRAKLRQSTQATTPQYTVTPVRRSNRLSYSAQKYDRTPLVLCRSIRKIDPSLAPVFVPNKNLPNTP